MRAQPVAGGGRRVMVDPERLERWIDGFATRHGLDTPWGPLGLELVGLDGATARFHAPPGVAPPTTLDELVTVAATPRRVGLLLARQSSVAVGVADGPRLTRSKVDTFYVQSRTAAGGWSQQRYARRRVNQALAAAHGAADAVVRVLLPVDVEVLVCGGDKRTVEAILTDPRLAGLALLRAERFLDVAEPRLAVLEQAVGLARQVEIVLHDPGTPVR